MIRSLFLDLNCTLVTLIVRGVIIFFYASSLRMPDRRIAETLTAKAREFRLTNFHGRCGD